MDRIAALDCNLVNSDSTMLPSQLQNMQMIRSKAFLALGKLPSALLNVMKVVTTIQTIAQQQRNLEISNQLRGLESRQIRGCLIRSSTIGDL
jgi:hypothetical protein